MRLRGTPTCVPDSLTTFTFTHQITRQDRPVWLFDKMFAYKKNTPSVTIFFGVIAALALSLHDICSMCWRVSSNVSPLHPLV